MTFWHSLHGSLRTRFRTSGLDLVAPLNARWYRRTDREPLRPLRRFSDDAFLIVAGNTRSMWPQFLDAIRRNPRLLRDPDPLDTWVERRVHEVLEPVDIEHRVLWGHEPMASGSFPPLQHLAEIAGLAAVSPTHLSVHPVYGPWIALRAAILFDVPGPSGSPPEPPSPCRPCGPDCERALERALRGAEGDEVAAVRNTWRQWVAVRDACEVGSDYRYSDEQIEYHYRKERDLLARVAGVERPS